MANSPTGGYDYRFVTEPPDSLKCLICLSVVRNPQQHTRCGRLFCETCLQEHKRQYRQPFCPSCRGPLATFSDARSLLEVNSLQVRCQHQQCSWTGDLCAIDSHLSRCAYSMVPCPRNCGTSVKKKLLKEHENSECSKRDHMCPHCLAYGPFDLITTKHAHKCPKVVIHCPNGGCNAKYLRCESDEHERVCELKLLTCKYKEYGCDHKDLRRNMKLHERNTELHMELIKEKVTYLTKKVDSLEKRVEAWKFTFQLINYRELKEGNEAYCSRPFYSHENGYKLDIKVFLNGHDTYKYRGISVYCFLKKGDFDDQLKWPFTGKVKIELLNQREDNNHYVFLTTFPSDDDSVSGRVTGEKPNEGWGRPDFISHASLRTGPYLVNDRLVFRVSVEVPEYKPWLQCNI